MTLRMLTTLVLLKALIKSHKLSIYKNLWNLTWTHSIKPFSHNFSQRSEDQLKELYATARTRLQQTSSSNFSFPYSFVLFWSSPLRAVGAMSLESRMRQGQPTLETQYLSPAPVVCQADRAESRHWEETTNKTRKCSGKGEGGWKGQIKG